MTMPILLLVVGLWPKMSFALIKYLRDMMDLSKSSDGIVVDLISCEDQMTQSIIDLRVSGLSHASAGKDLTISLYDIS
jgi:hypothetical protein